MSEKLKFEVGSKGVGWEDADMMMVGGKGGLTGSGRLMIFKRSGTIRALPPMLAASKELARGNFKDKARCPVASDGLPIAEVLLLSALRLDADVTERALALWRLRDQEGESLPGSEEHPWIAGNQERFHTFVADWIVTVAIRDGADGVRQIADWIEAGERIRNAERSKIDSDFLRAVEESASDGLRIPTQKEVRALWEAGGGDERKGKKAWENCRDRNGFSWLPIGTRGPSSLLK